MSFITNAYNYCAGKVNEGATAAGNFYKNNKVAINRVAIVAATVATVALVIFAAAPATFDQLRSGCSALINRVTSFVKAPFNWIASKINSIFFGWVSQSSLQAVENEVSTVISGVTSEASQVVKRLSGK